VFLRVLHRNGYNLSYRPSFRMSYQSFRRPERELGQGKPTFCSLNKSPDWSYGHFYVFVVCFELLFWALFWHVVVFLAHSGFVLVIYVMSMQHE